MFENCDDVGPWQVPDSEIVQSLMVSEPPGNVAFFRDGQLARYPDTNQVIYGTIVELQKVCGSLFPKKEIRVLPLPYTSKGSS